jgi:alanyl-tRNA synthetase
MTRRLYYDDPYLVRFAARVLEQLQWFDDPDHKGEGHPAVVLDRTAFYPTGGGQPHDVGSLNSVPVVDVIEREADGAVIHRVERPLDVAQVEGRVDWERRFDLMQQHTGQHILSAAFVERLGANTVGFHLAEAYATIDLDRAPLSADDLDDVETWANAAVFDNRSVAARFVPDEVVASLRLRKPVAHEGPVRIVEIPGLDCSACGGTHVRTTGEVGLIKITRSERRGIETRVEFLCGRRALADYRAKNALVMGLAREFTVGHWELADLVHRLADELKETRRELGRTRDALLDAEATALWHQAVPQGARRVIRAHLVGRTPDDLKHLAQRLVAHPRALILLASTREVEGKAYLTFARSADLDVHVGSLLREACQVIGGRGGGRPDFAQGGGPQVDQVPQALDLAFQSMAGSMKAEREGGA